MKNSRAFQVISSIVIAYIIQRVLIALLGVPVFSYDRVYISLVCILMMVSSMFRSSSYSGLEYAKEERVVDGQGRTGRIFENSRYPGIKVLEETSEGKSYITDQGEVITTKYVTTTKGEVNNEDFVIGLSAVILLICIVTLVFSGIGSLLSQMFAETQNNTSQFIESLAAQRSEEETDAPDEAYDTDESGPNNDPDQLYTGGEEAQGDVPEEDVVLEEDVVPEEDAVQGENEAVFIDFGIYTDGHGITASEYVIEDSNSRKLTKEDTDRLTLRGINYAKNELFARHGRKFISEELQDFFESRVWYNGSREADPATDERIKSEFNSFELYNCDLLYKLEKSMGMYELD